MSKWTRTFTFKGKEIYYNGINFNNPTERAVEVPIAFDFIANLPKANKILEIGNVLSQYEKSLSEKLGLRARQIVDKFEIDLGVENQDLMELDSHQKYDAIVSISSVEHIGQGDDPSGVYGEQVEKRDLEAPLKAIAKIYDLLELEGKALITVPFGRLTDAEWYIQFSKDYLDLLWKKYSIPKEAISANYLKLIDRETVNDKHYMLWQEVEAGDLSESEYGWPWSQANAIAVLEISKLSSDFTLNFNVEPTPLYYYMTYEQRRELEQYKSQLHQTQKELAQSQSQMYQAQAELEQSLSQLNQTQKDLEVAQGHLYSIQEELESTQNKLYQAYEDCDKFQSLMYQTQEELELAQNKLYQAYEDCDKFQSLMYQAQEELESVHIQLHQFPKELENSRTEQYQLRKELEQLQSQLELNRKELEQSQLQVHSTQKELERYRLQYNAVKVMGSDKQEQYGSLVWEAWYAYRNGDLRTMSQSLQKSLSCTPFSSTETVLNWLEKFSQFSLENGESLDTYSLSRLSEWKELTRRVTAVKTPVRRF